MTDVAMFKMPPQIEVRPAKAALPEAEGKPEWGKYKVKTPVRCDDCNLSIYEALMVDDWSAPPARFARQQRRHGGVTRLLCDDHARLRRIEDAQRAAGVSHMHRKGDAR